MKNSLSISINPQIYIQNYVGAKTFSRITNIDINSYDKLNRNNPAAMVRMQQDSSHVIICNISDKHHYEKHIVKLASELNIPLKYGLSSKENVLIWTFDALGGHQTFETISIYSAIDYIAKKFKETNQITRDMANLAITTNIFWKDFYAERNKNITLQETKNILVLKEECALTADKDTQERTIHINIPQNKTHNYNHTRLEINKNSINTIKISSKSITSSAKSFSILIYNFSKKCILHQKNYTLDADITFNFIINDTEDDVAICIYAGLCGQTKGHTFSATVELLEKSLLQKTFSIDETHDEESLNNESKAVEEIAEQYTAQQVKTDQSLIHSISAFFNKLFPAHHKK